MKLGMLIVLDGEDIDEKFSRVHSLGLSYCQLNCWNHKHLTADVAKQVVSACEKYDIKISTFWCGWSGPCVWDFYKGPVTIGLVPSEYREQRINELKAGSDFAKLIGVEMMATHLGFIPENPNDPAFSETVCAVRQVAEYCKSNGQKFLCETGQETPVTLSRLIKEVGVDNMGVNFDTGNLILYGKANPVDALDILEIYIKDIHAKDGFYPTEPKSLGEECKVGLGKVNFPAFISKLKAMNYSGHITIEREIKGEQQTIDIQNTISYLRELWEN